MNRTALIGAALTLLGLGTVADAAPTCSTKMLEGIWAATTFSSGDGAADVDICAMQLNRKGQIMAWSCFDATTAKPIKSSQKTTGRFQVTKACEVTGTVKQGRKAEAVTGTLDPAKGILPLKPAGDDAPFVFYQQW